MRKILFLFLAMIFTVGGVSAQISLNIDIKTGDDDLMKADYQENPEIVIGLTDGREVRKESINRGQTWPNQSLRRVTVDLPDGVALNDLRDFKLYRERNARGRGMIWDYLKKDNWTVKAIKITAVLRGAGPSTSRVILDLNPRGNVYRFVFDPTTARNEGQMFMASLRQPEGPMPIPAVDQNAKVTVTFGTGNDDLRGRGDNVSMVLKFAGSPMTINVENLNQGMRWADRTENTITREIPNSSSLDINSISEVVIRHDGGAGSNDEWVMNKVRVVIRKNAPRTETDTGKNDFVERSKILISRTEPSLFRFTNRARQTSYRVTDATSQQALRNATITAEFTTGDDDLRGGNDNVSITIRFHRSPRTLTLRNLNNGATWPNLSTRRITNKEIPSSHDIDINDIKSIEVRHSGGGGTGADNWDLRGLKVTINKEDSSRILVDEVRHLHRFTGDSRGKVFQVN